MGIRFRAFADNSIIYRTYQKQHNPWDFIPRDECTSETYLETEFVSVSEDTVTGNYAVYRDATKEELLASGTFTDNMDVLYSGKLDIGE